MRLCTWFAGIDLDSRYLTATLGFSTDGQMPRILGSKVFDVDSVDGNVPDFRQPLQSALLEAGQWFHLETGGALNVVAVALSSRLVQEMSSSGACHFGAPTLIDSAEIKLVQDKALGSHGQRDWLVSSVVRSFEIDGRQLSTPPLGVIATSLRVEMTSWLARTAAMQPIVDAVKMSGLDVGLVRPRAVAGAEAVLTATERREGATVVLIGDTTTEVATFADSSLVDVCSVPLGRKPLVAEIARACNVSVAVVDRLDLSLMLDRAPSDPMVQRVRTVLSAWGTALFTAVRHRLDERDLAWRLSGGVVIGNSRAEFATLDERAVRIVGTPARFATMSPMFHRVSGVSHGSFAALGLISAQWNASQADVPSVVDERQPEPAVSRSIEDHGIPERGGIGQAISRWLREFVPAGDYSS